MNTEPPPPPFYFSHFLSPSTYAPPSLEAFTSRGPQSEELIDNIYPNLSLFLKPVAEAEERAADALTIKSKLIGLTDDILKAALSAASVFPPDGAKTANYQEIMNKNIEEFKALMAGYRAHEGRERLCVELRRQVQQAREARDNMDR